MSSPEISNISYKEVECPRCHENIKIYRITHPVLGGFEVYPDYDNYVIAQLMDIIKAQNKVIEHLMLYAKLEAEIRRLGFKK